jgi:hypothetical protein
VSGELLGLMRIVGMSTGLRACLLRAVVIINMTHTKREGSNAKPLMRKEKLPRAESTQKNFSALIWMFLSQAGFVLPIG